MKNLVILIAFVLVPFYALSQVEISIKELEVLGLSLPEREFVHTVVMTINNKTEKSKIIYMRNNPRITGYKKIDGIFPNPIDLIGEYYDTMFINK